MGPIISFQRLTWDLPFQIRTYGSSLRIILHMRSIFRNYCMGCTFENYNLRPTFRNYNIGPCLEELHHGPHFVLMNMGPTIKNYSIDLLWGVICILILIIKVHGTHLYIISWEFLKAGNEKDFVKKFTRAVL